ncbi:YhdP family protein [Flavobacterium sp. MXW15]|uniref:YhdP family protein n=1 Tax=Xanthomonas chitinilytica TaxID=2989819 RepID=A0ABT3JRU3_9XANT|nr:YhdP family protein [Xanthomonas sp. H13-6]MCW4453746.1 YhdP family protein [Flavobacterium sp. MXW15]MCW4471206.1 YhdP family protein [Xanthomonas sp. H13-6]
MRTPPRRRLRLLRRYALYALAIVLVCVALLVGAISQLLPLAEQHPDKVAAWLSARAGQPVSFDDVDTAWTRRGPLLRLEGLRIGAGDGVRIGQAEVLVSLYSGLFPGWSFTELRLRGLSLTLQRDDDGRWSVRGLPTTGTGGDPLDTLRNLGELQVIGGRLRVEAPSLGIQTEVPRIDLRLRVDGQRLRAGARGWIDAGAPPLVAVLDFERQRGDGHAWVAAEPADLAAWSQLLHFAGVRVQGGKGSLRSWVQLHDHRVVEVTTEADLRQLQLSGAALPDDGAVPAADFDTLQLRARWRHSAEGWRLDAPRLRIGGTGEVQRLDGLLLAGGERFALVGEQLDLTPLLRIAALSERLQPELRQWLYRAGPQLRFSQVQVGGLRGGTLRGSGELEEVAFATVGDVPGVEGLRGHFEGDGEGVELTLQPDSTLHFDWPSGFGEVHDVRLAGRIVGWREGTDWRVATPAMRVQGTDYAADVRGGLRFQGDGTRPWMELAADLDDVPMTVAKRFWVRSQMSQEAIDWLDAALVDGHVRNGRGLVTGDLDDWPFDQNNGRFEASGQIDRGAIRFQHDWPLMRQVDADIAFIGNGFQIHGKGELAGVPVNRFEAGIADFGQSRLQVKATSQGDAAQLLAMLRQSPLQKTYAETLDNLQVSGPARVAFDLLQPLHEEDGAGRLGGEVELRGARLADKRWDLQFDDVHGKARYSDGGFEAPALAVRMDEREGVLELRAGSHVADPRNVFEAQLAAALDATRLLERAPELAWLKPQVRGTSRWTVGVEIPQAADGGKVEPPTSLRLQSDLVGTRLQLPAPLDKPASEPLPTTVAASLPLGSGRVDVAFGRLLALAARSQDGKTGVQVTMGSNRVEREPPAEGLVVTGRTGSLDALEWIGLARGQEGDAETGGDTLPLRHVDVQAGRLLLAGGVFADTRLQLRPGADAVAVQLDGPALAGSLSVPEAEGGTIVGKLARVHWQMQPAAAVAADADADTDAATPVVAIADPAKVPPLALDIDDLQFGNARLGQASLRTRPLADGLRVEQLQLRAPRQAIDVQGEWRGSGADAHTRLSARVDSDDLGALMQNLDYGGQLRGGQGRFQFDAGWPGGPAAFQLAALDGTLAVQARNGQLLELEPGAGRVLGLLSVAQLPRRLMLDFRDFFSKGFAFNQVEGQVAFGQGMARTERVAIEGPAADIVIRGQADLRAQQFDQTIDVNPRSGNLLTVVGAVAGGPVGAAVGAAANAVLSKPLGEIGAKTYRVTGPWKEPKVEVIERESPRPAPIPVPAAGNDADTL